MLHDDNMLHRVCKTFKNHIWFFFNQKEKAYLKNWQK